MVSMFFCLRLKGMDSMVLQYTKVISDIRNGGKLPTVMFSKILFLHKMNLILPVKIQALQK